MKGNTWKHSLTTLLVALAVALMVPSLLLAHKNNTSSAISFSPSNTVNAGTLVTITGTVTFTGTVSTGSSTGHGTVPSAGTPVVGDNAMIQRALDANGNHVACENAVSFGNNFVGPTPTDSLGQISGVFNTTGLGGQTLGFRTHHPDGGGPHGAGQSSGGCANLVILAQPEGCSHGFWKTHDGSGPQPSEWGPTGFVTTTTLQGPFTIPSAFSLYSTNTLRQALDYPGGPGPTGGFLILMRNAVAALLNAAHPDVAYPLTVAQVQSAVDTAIATADRDTMLALNTVLDGYNNLGCPLPLD